MVTSPDVIQDFLPGKTIRILFYCDQRDMNWEPVPQPGTGERLRRKPTEFGLRIAKDLLEAQSTLTLRFDVDVLNRHYDYDGNGAVVNFAGPMQAGKHKLTPNLLKRYDQVWFFGQLYANYRTEDPDYGNADSELTDAEVSALRSWMDAGGGVLMTGDHSNDASYRDSELVDASLAGKILNLGRAIGYRVPRAGSMRVWVGEPGAFSPHYVVDTANDPDMSAMPKQEDGIPQDIRVAQMAQRVYISIKQPPFVGDSVVFFDDHPLFKARSTPDFPRPLIDILPDHTHEGAIAIPEALDPSEWPSRGNVQPKPHVAAWGTNWYYRLTGQISATWGIDKPVRLYPEIPLVAAYDGARVGVGRIVSHTTWHHFVNVNLVGFRNADGTPGTMLERMAEYYANLAIWLSPKKKRSALSFDLIRWAAAHPVVREVRGAAPFVVGQTASQLLMNAIGAGPYADLVQLAFDDLPELGETAACDTDSVAHMAASVQIPHQLVLGYAVAEEARHMSTPGEAKEGDGAVTLRHAAVQAARVMGEDAEQRARSLRALADQFDPHPALPARSRTDELH
jgi:hypothetical protein